MAFFSQLKIFESWRAFLIDFIDFIDFGALARIHLLYLGTISFTWLLSYAWQWSALDWGMCILPTGKEGGRE